MKPKTPSKTVSEKSTSNRAVGASLSNASGDDAVEMLKSDHRKVEQMFAQCSDMDSSGEKSKLVRKIANALVIHSMLEQEIFYPACRQAGVEDELMDEAQVEHDVVGMMLNDLARSSPEASFYDAKVKVLAEYVQLHVSEEEKPSSGIFAKAKAAGLDMAELGKQIKERKMELEEQAEDEGFIPPTSRSLGIQRYSHYGDTNMARNHPERDEQGRFVSDDDRHYGRSRYQDDDRSYRSRSDYDDDRGGRYSQMRDDDNRQSRYSHGGWYGDREGHSRASERGWEGRRSEYEDDRGRYSRMRDDDRPTRYAHGGWYGDPEGHSRASERGWEGRRRDEDDDRSRYSRARRDDNDYYSQSSRGWHGGWFGDPEGHSRAAELGWERRYDEDDRGGRSGYRGR